jgi:hypothetical protein
MARLSVVRPIQSQEILNDFPVFIPERNVFYPRSGGCTIDEQKEGIKICVWL